MPIPSMPRAPRSATPPQKAPVRPTAARQQRTAAAITYGRPDTVADSHIARSNAAVAQAMQTTPTPGSALPLDPVWMLRMGQDVVGNAAVARFAWHTMTMTGPPAGSGPPPLVLPPGPKPKGNPGLSDRITGAVGTGDVAPVTPASVKPSVASWALKFRPIFGGDAGVLQFENLNAAIKLRPNVRNASSAPAGTTLTWSWGAKGVDGVEKGDISPATGRTATFNAKARKPSPSGGSGEMAANLGVATPSKAEVVHPVNPPCKSVSWNRSTSSSRPWWLGPVAVAARRA